jgi:hypothetical protein
MFFGKQYSAAKERQSIREIQDFCSRYTAGRGTDDFGQRDSCDVDLFDSGDYLNDYETTNMAASECNEDADGGNQRRSSYVKSLTLEGRG